ncbi:hypothetical protein AAG906_011046 [Vitis piasezkii]
MEHEIDPTYYDEAISDVDTHLSQKAMEAELESMHFNQVWELVEAPEGIKPRGVDGKVETFKARLVTKGYNLKHGFDYEETFSPVAMIKFIKILLSIATHLDYEIWLMDVKTAFTNGNLDESIFMMQPDDFVAKGSRAYVKIFDFDQNEDEPWLLSSVKIRFSTQFQMKDLGEAQYILGIKDSKKGVLPFRHGIPLSQDQCLKTLEEKEHMQSVPYASTLGSLMYIPSMENLVDPFTKTLIGRVFVGHKDNIGVR